MSIKEADTYLVARHFGGGGSILHPSPSLPSAGVFLSGQQPKMVSLQCVSGQPFLFFLGAGETPSEQQPNLVSLHVFGVGHPSWNGPLAAVLSSEQQPNGEVLHFFFRGLHFLSFRRVVSVFIVVAHDSDTSGVTEEDDDNSEDVSEVDPDGSVVSDVDSEDDVSEDEVEASETVDSDDVENVEPSDVDISVGELSVLNVLLVEPSDVEASELDASELDSTVDKDDPSDEVTDVPDDSVLDGSELPPDTEVFSVISIVLSVPSELELIAESVEVIDVSVDKSLSSELSGFFTFK